MRYFAVLFVLCPATLSAAEPPSSPVPAIAFGRTLDLINGQIRLLAFCNDNGTWIENSFVPKGILKFPEERLYAELAPEEKPALHAYNFRLDEYPKEIEILDKDARKNPHKIFLHYSPEQYEGMQTLADGTFMACNTPKINFQVETLFASLPFRNTGIITLAGSLEGSDDSLETFKEAIAAPYRGPVDAIERDVDHVFVTAGPTDAAIEIIDNAPAFQAWLERGKAQLVKLHQDQYRENANDAENEAHQELRELMFLLASIEAKSAPQTAYTPTEEELNEFKNSGLTMGADPAVAVSYLYAVRQAYPDVADLSNVELLGMIAEVSSKYFAALPAGDDESVLNYLRDKINTCEQKIAEGAPDKHHYLSDPETGTGIDSALYKTNTLIKRIALPGIFSGIWLHAEYKYPKDKLPPQVQSFSGNYMALINSDVYSEDNIVWEISSRYDRSADSFDSIEYEFAGICDVNKDGIPEILLGYGAHECSGLKAYELADNEMRLIADYEFNI